MTFHKVRNNIDIAPAESVAMWRGRGASLVRGSP